MAVVHFGFGRDIYTIPPENVTSIRKVGKRTRYTLIETLNDLVFLYWSDILFLQYQRHEAFYPRFLSTNLHRSDV